MRERCHRCNGRHYDGDRPRLARAASLGDPITDFLGDARRGEAGTDHENRRNNDRRLAGETAEGFFGIKDPRNDERQQGQHRGHIDAELLRHKKIEGPCEDDEKGNLLDRHDWYHSNASWSNR